MADVYIPQYLLFLFFLLALPQKHRLDDLSLLCRQMAEVRHRWKRRSSSNRRHVSGTHPRRPMSRKRSDSSRRHSGGQVDARRHGHLERTDKPAIGHRRTVGERRSDVGGHNESMRQAAVVAGHVGVELLQLANDALLYSPTRPGLLQLQLLLRRQ